MGSHCEVLVQSSSCSWVGAKSLLKVMGLTHRPALHSGLVLFHCSETPSVPSGAVWGTTGAAPWRCLLSVCLQREGGTRLAREELCRSRREWPLGTHLGEEEMLSPEPGH